MPKSVSELVLTRPNKSEKSFQSRFMQLYAIQCELIRDFESE